MPALKKSIRCYSVKRRWTGGCALDQYIENVKMKRPRGVGIEMPFCKILQNSKTVGWSINVITLITFERNLHVYFMIASRIRVLVFASACTQRWRRFRFVLCFGDLSLKNLEFSNWNLTSQIEISVLKLKSQNLRFHLWCYFANTPLAINATHL